jgi:hypothetical protein
MGQRRTYFFILVVSSLALVLTFLTLAFHSIDETKRAKSSAASRELTTAILAYYTEYAELPPVSSNATLVRILAGENKRKIVFLAPSATEINSKGEMIDGSGNPLRISLPNLNHLVVSSASLLTNSKQSKTLPGGVYIDIDDN